MFLFWFFYCILLWIQKIFVPVKVIGKKKYLRNQPLIIICNHQSNLDPVLIPFSLRTEPHILAKHTLMKTKFTHWLFSNLSCIPVNRGEVGLSTIKAVLNVLKDGEQMLIFPEGTRRDILDESTALKGGVAMFSLKADCYIQPVFFLKKPRAFRINKLVVGEPFKLAEFEGQKLTSEVLDEASKIVGHKLLELKENYYLELEQKKAQKLLQRQNKKQPK